MHLKIIIYFIRIYPDITAYGIEKVVVVNDLI